MKVQEINSQLDKMIAEGKDLNDFADWLSTQYNINGDKLDEALEQALEYNAINSIDDTE